MESNKQNKSKDNNNAAAADSSEQMKDLMTSNSSSWTILPADRIEVLESSTSAVASSLEMDAGARELPEKSSSEPANERCPPVADTDAQAEDFSDGISIISDCESTGRLTPSPTLRALLNDLNTSFELGNDLLPPTPTHHAAHSQQLRMRRQQLQDSHDDIDNVQSKPATVAELSSQQSSSLMGYRLPALVQSGFTAVFYVCCTLAVLAFVGRLRNPEWQMLGNDKQLTQLEQRLVELELQNNLMRAEIDIMSKQLNYLSGQAQAPPSSSSTSFQGRKLKTFKAWPGNGNSGDPVDITKQDLKRPYKCPDGQFVEIAGMCVESKPHAESLTDEIGNVVNDVLQQSQAFQHFEKLTEKLGTLAGGADNEEQQPQMAAASETPQAFLPHGDKSNNFNVNRGKERYQGKQNYEKFKEHHFKGNEYDYNKQHSTRSKSNENDSDENSKERKPRGKSNEHDSNEHSNEHTRYKSNENDSKERTRYKSNEHDSKERHHKKYADKSKERYAKKSPHHQQHGQQDDSGSGEWHERMMQQREHARQRQEQKRNNNWYIERGGSREQRRSGENRR